MMSYYKPIRKVVFSFNIVAACCLSSCAPQNIASRPAALPNKPTPIASLSLFSAKELKSGIIQINLGDIGMPEDNLVKPLSTTLQKFPKATQFQMSWSTTLASSSSTNKVLYNRRAHVLFFDAVNEMAGTEPRAIYITYRPINDSVIHKAGKLLRTYIQSDGGFSRLDKYGAKVQRKLVRRASVERKN